MNKEYTYVDGKVIISDENDNKDLREYCDNLDEILVQENLIETMEEEMQDIECSSELKYNRKYYIPVCIPTAVLISTIGAPFITNWLNDFNSFAISVDTIFGPMSHAMSVSVPVSIFSIPIAAIIELFLYIDHKNNIKTKKGCESELAFLRKEIEKSKEELERLNQNKARYNEITESRTSKVDDKKKMELLIEYLNLYFNLGYYREKYYKYYQEGRLEQKLQKYYNYTEIEIIKRCLEKEGHSLSLKY